MTLPLTITIFDGTLPVSGVFKSSAGNFYAFSRDPSTPTTLNAGKASDPTSSWSTVASKTGFAGTSAIQCVAGFQVSDVIHLAVYDGTFWTSCNIKYLQFDMSTDTFSAVETVQSAMNLAPTSTSGNESVYGTGIVVRSGGNVIIFYNGPVAANMGSNYARVFYKKRTAANTYGSAVAVDAGGTTNYVAANAVLGASDAVYFFYKATNSLTTRRLSSADVFGTANTNSSITPEPGAATSGNTPAVSYSRSGTTKIVCVGSDLTTLQSAQYNDDSGTFNTSTIRNAAFNLSPGCMLGNLGTDVYAFISDNSTPSNLLMAKSTDDGATWSSPSTVYAPSAQITRHSRDGDFFVRSSSNVFGYFVYDGTNLKYNEYAPATTNNQAINVSQPESFAGSTQAKAGTNSKSLTVLLAESFAGNVRLTLRGPGTLVMTTPIVSTLIKKFSLARTILSDQFHNGVILAAIAVTVTGTAAHELVTLTKSTKKTIIAQLAELVSNLTVGGKARSFTIPFAESFTLSRNLSKTIFVGTSHFLGDVVSLVAHNIVVSSSQVVNLITGLNLVKTISTTSTQLVTLAKRASHAILTPMGQAISKSLLTRIGITTQGISSTISLTKSVFHKTGVSFPLTVVISKQVTKLLSTIWTKAVTLATSFVPGQVTNPLTIVITQTQLATLFRTATHVITFTQTQLATLFRTATHVVKVTQAQLILLIRFVAHVLRINSTQLLMLASASSKLVRVLQPEFVALTKTLALNRLINVLQIQTIALGKAGVRTTLVTIGQILTLGSFTIHMITVALAETVTLLRWTGRIILITWPQTITRTAATALQRTINVITNETTTLVRTAAKSLSISVSQTQLFVLIRSVSRLILATVAQTIILGKSVGHAVTLSIPELVTLVTNKATAGGKAITVLQTQAIILNAKTAHLINVLQIQNVLLLKTTVHIIKVSSTELITTIRRKIRPKVITTIISAELLTLRRNVQKTVNVLTNEVLTLIRKTAITVRFTIVPIITLANQPVRRVAIVSTELVTLTKNKFKILLVSSAELVKFVKQSPKEIDLLLVQLITLRNKIGKLVFVISASLLLMFRGASSTSRTFTVVSSSVITLNRGIRRAFGITQASVVSIGKLTKAILVIASTELITLSLTQHLIRQILIPITSAITLGKSATKTILLGCGNLVSAGITRLWTITVSTGLLASLLLFRIKSISVGIAELISTFLKRRGRPLGEFITDLMAFKRLNFSTTAKKPVTTMVSTQKPLPVELTSLLEDIDLDGKRDLITVDLRGVKPKQDELSGVAETTTSIDWSVK